jgi:uncharacterized protein with PIN domain
MAEVTTRAEFEGTVTRCLCCGVVMEHFPPDRECHVEEGMETWRCVGCGRVAGVSAVVVGE